MQTSVSKSMMRTGMRNTSFERCVVKVRLGRVGDENGSLLPAKRFAKVAKEDTSSVEPCGGGAGEGGALQFGTLLDGGDAPQSEPCDPFSQHGLNAH